VRPVEEEDADMRITTGKPHRRNHYRVASPDGEAYARSTSRSFTVTGT